MSDEPTPCDGENFALAEGEELYWRSYGNQAWRGKVKGTCTLTSWRLMPSVVTLDRLSA